MSATMFGLLLAVVMQPTDPATVWDRDELYRVPKVTEHQGPFRGEVTPIWIEGVPYRGKPTRCFAFLGLPKGASVTNKVPGIVLVHGGLGTAYPEWVRLWTERGYAAIAVDNCGQVPVMGADGKWMANPEGGPRGWGEAAVKSVDDPICDQWMYHAIATSVRAHSYLRSLDAVDASNIGVTGISWGAFQTCILAALDTRFAYAVPVYGCGFNFEPGGISSREVMGAGAEKWSDLWDPARFLPYAKCPFLWVDGTNDFAFELDRVVRSAKLAKGESQFCTRLRMVHAHGPAGEAPAEILAFADHYARKGRDIIRLKTPIQKDGVLTVPYVANGRMIVRAELLWTADGADVAWPKRAWTAIAVGKDAIGAASVSVRLPPEAAQVILNIIDSEGLIASSETVKTPLFSATPLERKISSEHKIFVSDNWGGGHRIIFDFKGHKGWIVEPPTGGAAAKGMPWLWTMQWMGAFIDRTGAPELTAGGYHHVHLEAFDERATDEGLALFADFQSYLVDTLGFAPKANLIGMSWGGFFSVRYASVYPEKVAKIYLDAPLLDLQKFEGNGAYAPTEAAKKIGPWGLMKPSDGSWTKDPRMPVNRAVPIAKAKIPILLLYGGQDQTVSPQENCELFAARFKAAGGDIDVKFRGGYGHHPHGAEPGDRSIVDFFAK